MRIAFVFLLTITLFSGAIISSAQADVPSTMTVQGRLLDSTGQPVPNGSHPATFSIWDDSTGGTQLWFENGDIPTQDGRFSQCMGCIVPFADLFAQGTTWMQVSVDGEALLPRIRISSVPYALSSSKISGDIVTRPGGMTLTDADSYFDVDSDDDGVTMELRESPTLPTRGMTAAVDATGSSLQLRESPTRRIDMATDATGSSFHLRESPTRRADLSVDGESSQFSLGDVAVPEVLITGQNGVGTVITARETGSGMATGRRTAEALTFTDSTGTETARYHKGHVTILKAHDTDESVYICPDSIIFTDSDGAPTAVSSRYHDWRWSSSKSSRISEDCDDADPSISIEQNGSPLAVFHVMNGNGEVVTAREAGSGMATGRRTAEALTFADSTGTETARYHKGHVTILKAHDTDESVYICPDSIIFTDPNGDPAMVSSRYHEWRWNNASGSRISEDCDDTEASISIDEAGTQRVKISSSSSSDVSSIAIDEPGAHLAISADASTGSSVLHQGDLDGNGTLDMTVESGVHGGGGGGGGGGSFSISEPGFPSVVELAADASSRRLEIRNLGSSGEDGVELRCAPETSGVDVVRLNGLPPGTPVIGRASMTTTNTGASVAVGDLDGDGRADLSATTNGARCAVANIGSSGEDGVSIRAIDTGSEVRLWHKEPGMLEVPNVTISSDATGGVVLTDVLRLEPRATAPSSPVEGELYVDSITRHIYCFLGGTWKQLDN